MIKAGIIGGSGYVAGELIRLLVHHPQAKIDFIYSHSEAGELVASVHEDMLTLPDLYFTDSINPDVDVAFLCLGHGHSKKFISEHNFSKATKIIDLGNDFRLAADSELSGKSFVYGLVEANKKTILKAQYVANPGCFATAIQLAVLPLASAGLLADDLHIHAITGSTGAGKVPSDATHFSWRNNNISIYKAFQHQHLDEITETVQRLQLSFSNNINFLPVRGDFSRGIFASLYTNSSLSAQELLKLYQEFYAAAPFVVVTDKTVHLKQVVNSNYCFLQVEKIGSKVLITSVIDNLLKGASGQAVQNMNLLFGLDEGTSLHLKPSYF